MQMERREASLVSKGEVRGWEGGGGGNRILAERSWGSRPLRVNVCFDHRANTLLVVLVVCLPCFSTRCWRIFISSLSETPIGISYPTQLRLFAPIVCMHVHYSCIIL